MKLNSLLKRYIKRFSLSNIKPKTVYLGIFILLACFLIFNFFIKPNVVEGFISDEDIKSRLRRLLLVSNQKFVNELIQIHKDIILLLNQVINKSFNTKIFFIGTGIGTGDKKKIVTTNFLDEYVQYFNMFIKEYPYITKFMKKVLPLLNDIPELYYKDLNEDEKQLINIRLDFIWSNFKNIQDVIDKYNKEINEIIITIPNSLKTQESAGGQITIPTTSTYGIIIKKKLQQLIVELEQYKNINNNLKIQFLLENLVKNQHYINFAEVEKRKFSSNLSYRDISGNGKTYPYPDISGNVNTSFTPVNSPLQYYNFDDDIIGDYQNSGPSVDPKNLYNYATITKLAEGKYIWTTVQTWTLYKDGTNTNYLIVGNDCPYYNSGYTIAAILRTPGSKKVIGIVGPGNGTFMKIIK